MSLCLTCTMGAQSAEKIVPIKYGNMDNWVIRNIKESGIIGGNKKVVYAIGPSMTINGNTPYTNKGGSPSGTSNVLAHVSGIYKTNNSVYRDKHENGHCAKLVTHIEKVKVWESSISRCLQQARSSWATCAKPITGTKTTSLRPSTGAFLSPMVPRQCVSTIRPCCPTQPPASSRTASAVHRKWQDATMLSPFSICRSVTRMPMATSRPERGAPLVVKYSKSTNGWVNDATYTIHYGDIRHMAGYDASLMGLRSTDYARNSKGKSVIIKETGWASANETPDPHSDHLRSLPVSGGAYIGTPGNTLWIDNVALVY